MVGMHPGRVTSQAQILASFFSSAGYPVERASSVLNRYLRLLDIVRTIVRLRNRTDILILEIYGGPSFVVEDIAGRLAQLFGIPIIMWLHGGALPQFMKRFPNWTRRVLGRASLLVAPSQYLAHAVVPYGFEATVIPNTIDLSDYPFRQRAEITPRLFWMRSFHQIWNPFMALRVLARLRQFVPEASLVMAGPDKGLATRSREMAHELGIHNAVTFPGFLDSTQKIHQGNAADIYINTNRVDNMPLAVVEACAMGLPVITTAVGGIKDLLKDGETGLLVPDNDDEAMVQAIKRLLGDPTLAGQLSINGRRLAERSSWEEVRPQWERMFAKVDRMNWSRKDTDL